MFDKYAPRTFDVSKTQSSPSFEEMKEIDEVQEIRIKAWNKIRQYQGLSHQEIIDDINKSFGNSTNITFTDAMIKVGLYGILTKECCESIKTVYEQTNSQEIHFHGVGSGHEVCSLINSNVFDYHKMPIVKAYDKDYQAVTEYLPYYDNIIPVNIKDRLSPSQSTNPDGSLKRILVVIFNSTPDMENDILGGMVRNNSTYTGVLMIGELFSGFCIQSKFIPTAEKMGYPVVSLTNFPGISYSDPTWNSEYIEQKNRYSKVTNNMFQMFLKNDKLINDDTIEPDLGIYFDLCVSPHREQIICSLIIHIYKLNNEHFSNYLNTEDLIILNNILIKNAEREDIPRELVMEYFKSLRRNGTEFMILLKFNYGIAKLVSDHFLERIRLVEQRTDYTIKLAMFQLIRRNYYFYLIEKNNINVQGCKGIYIKNDGCILCYQAGKIKCNKCEMLYCSEECQVFDEKYLNHTEECYNFIPIRFSVNGQVIQIRHWKMLIEDNQLKDELASLINVESVTSESIKFITSPYEKPIELEKDITKLSEGQELVDELTIQHCIDIIDEKINIMLFVIGK